MWESWNQGYTDCDILVRCYQRVDILASLKHGTLQHRRNCCILVCNSENYKTFLLDLQVHIFRSSVVHQISYTITRLHRTWVSHLKQKHWKEPRKIGRSEILQRGPTTPCSLLPIQQRWSLENITNSCQNS